MKKVISIILFFYVIWFFAQTNSKAIDFEFYKNGKIRNTKNLKILLVKNLDIISCEILNGKIKIPDLNGIFAIIGKIKNKKYIIDNVDFSKLNLSSKFIFGIENNIKNFKPISSEFPNFYILKNSTNSLQIENLEQAEKVYFVIFSQELFNDYNRKKVKNYNRYFSVKKS